MQLKPLLSLFVWRVWRLKTFVFKETILKTSDRFM